MTRIPSAHLEPATVGTAAYRYPLPPALIDRLGGIGLAAEKLDVDRRTIGRWLTKGVTDRNADRIACELGEWPNAIWSNYGIRDDGSDDPPTPDEPALPPPAPPILVADAPQLRLFEPPEDDAHAPALPTPSHRRGRSRAHPRRADDMLTLPGVLDAATG